MNTNGGQTIYYIYYILSTHYANKARMPSLYKLALSPGNYFFYFL